MDEIEFVNFGLILTSKFYINHIKLFAKCICRIDQSSTSTSNTKINYYTLFSSKNYDNAKEILDASMNCFSKNIQN